MGSIIAKFSKSDLADDTEEVEEDPDFCIQEDNSAIDAFDKVPVRKDFNQALARESVNDIKADLDTQDKVSLIYLLYGDSQTETALRYITQLVEGVELDVLEEWIVYATSNCIFWQGQLLEGLSIIQHYQALRKLGYSKCDVDVLFLPTNKHTSIYIPVTKKKMYQILETFEEGEMQLFLNIVQNYFRVNNFEFKRFDYLEMYLLYWTSIKYISTQNVENVSNAFQVMKNDLDIEELKIKNLILQQVIKMEVENLEIFHPVTTTCTNCRIVEREVENCYLIDHNHPGVCLIINQEQFYLEPDPDYKNLLPTHGKLASRTGTELDKNRLISTFTKFNYAVIVKNNLTHREMMEVIESTIQSVKKQSSLFVCILSHGLKGKVFGVNTITVKIESIKEIMCSKNNQNLRGKPKVLILQSCQGSQFEEVDEDEEKYAIDGPPSIADLFVFYATTPGFASIRDKTNGTWFIQSFCDQMENQSAHLHFDDICTLVQQAVTKKRWKVIDSTRTMVPMKTSTLTKYFYLPRIDAAK